MATLPPAHTPALIANGGDEQSGSPLAAAVPATIEGCRPIIRLKAALGRISSRPTTPTSAHNILQGFASVCSTKLDRSDFPTTLHRHPRNRDRSLDGGNKWIVLFNAIGSAIDTMQQLVRGHQGMSVADLERQICMVEAYADYEMDDLQLDGDDATGYRLVPKGGKGHDQN